MLRLFEQKEKKKRLYIDSVNKFESVIKKELINEEANQDPAIRREVKFVDLTNIPRLEKELILSKEERELRVGIIDRNFKDLISLRSLRTDHIRQRKPQLKSSKKLIGEDPQLPKLKKAFSLPRLKRSQSKMSKSRSMVCLQSGSCNLLLEMIKKLEESDLLISQNDSFLIKQDDFQDLLNYLMHLSRIDNKKNIGQLLEDHEKFEVLEDISEKIFYKFREKGPIKKRNTLKIDHTKIMFQYFPSGNEKKTRTVKLDKKKSEIMLREREEELVSIKMIPTRRKITSPGELIQKDVLEEEEGLKALDKIREDYKNVKIDMKEYTDFLLSPDFNANIFQMSPLARVEEAITKEIKQFYSAVMNDPMLVPALKQKLMINLISKIRKNFKINTNDFSKIAQQKSQSLDLFVDKMKDWIEKYELKQQYLVQLKKLFIIDTRVLLKKFMQMEEYLKNIQNGSICQYDGIVKEVTKSCRKVIVKYRNDTFFSMQ